MSDKSQSLPVVRVIGDPDTLEIVKAIVVRRTRFGSLMVKPLEPIVDNGSNRRIARALELRTTSDFEEAAFDVDDFGVSNRAACMALWRLEDGLVEATDEKFDISLLPSLAQEQLLQVMS